MSLLFTYTAEQLKISNRKQAAFAAGVHPSYLGAMTQAGFTAGRRISGAEILDWLRENPGFRRPRSKKHVLRKKSSSV